MLKKIIVFLPLFIMTACSSKTTLVTSEATENTSEMAYVTISNSDTDSENETIAELPINEDLINHPELADVLAIKIPAGTEVYQYPFESSILTLDSELPIPTEEKAPVLYTINVEEIRIVERKDFTLNSFGKLDFLVLHNIPEYGEVYIGDYEIIAAKKK